MAVAGDNQGNFTLVGTFYDSINFGGATLTNTGGGSIGLDGFIVQFGP